MKISLVLVPSPDCWCERLLGTSTKLGQKVLNLAKCKNWLRNWLEIVALQEIRWSGNGVIKKKDFSLYYSGTKEQLGQAGTGFILMGRMMNNVIGKGKYNNVSLVNMYARTEDKADSEKENFYEELQLVQ
jgi:hypothetical protein